jgi:hypothetical protein
MFMLLAPAHLFLKVESIPTGTGSQLVIEALVSKSRLPWLQDMERYEASRDYANADKMGR